jgi:hypothetical protein
MIGALILRTNLCGGKPEGNKLLRKSVGYRNAFVSSGAESALRKTCPYTWNQKHYIRGKINISKDTKML